MKNLHEFKKYVLSQAANEEMEIYLEDMINGNLKETSAFTMVFDYPAFMEELQYTDTTIYDKVKGAEVHE